MDIKITGKFPSIEIVAHGGAIEIAASLAAALNTFSAKAFGSEHAANGAKILLETMSGMDKTEIDFSDLIKGGERR